MPGYFDLSDRKCVQEGVASFPGRWPVYYYADRSFPACDRSYYHYGPYRKIKRIGLFRAWAAAKVDHYADSLIPPMRALDQVYKDSFGAEIYRSEETINRWSGVRQRWLLLERKERQRQREWGWDWRQKRNERRAADRQQG